MPSQIDLGLALAQGAMNPELLAQRAAMMGIMPPDVNQLRLAMAAPQTGNNPLSFLDPMIQQAGVQIDGGSPQPGSLNSLQPAMLPGAQQPAPPPSGSLGVPGAVPPTAQPTIMPQSVPSAPIPSMPPGSPVATPPPPPPSGGGIGSDYVAGGGTYPTAAPAASPADTATATESPLSKLLKGMQGVKPPGFTPASPAPAVRPPDAKQINPSATIIEMLMRQMQPNLAQATLANRFSLPR